MVSIRKKMVSIRKTMVSIYKKIGFYMKEYGFNMKIMIIHFLYIHVKTMVVYKTSESLDK